MFSGITQGLFTVKSLSRQSGLLHYSVVLNRELVKGLKIGASMAVDGVCQTVINRQGLVVSFQAMQGTGTLATTLNELFVNRRVSIERSMRFGDEIGGHELSGHVFETGIILDRKVTPNNLCLVIQCSEACFSFVKPKGYIAVDGSSLTVGLTDKKNFSFEIHLIPETLRRTNFLSKVIGDKVNLEPDMKTMMLVTVAQELLANIDLRLQKTEEKLQILLASVK